MNKKPVNPTVESILTKCFEDSVTGVKIRDYGPDDAVFTTTYGAGSRPFSLPKAKIRSPLELLRDYSNAWAEHGVYPPDLVFQTRGEGLGFYNPCLKSVAVHTLYTTHTPSSANGMCIARVMGVNLIWPEK